MTKRAEPQRPNKNPRKWAGTTASLITRIAVAQFIARMLHEWLH
jgi:hypothetical protein